MCFASLFTTKWFNVSLRSSRLYSFLGLPLAPSLLGRRHFFESRWLSVCVVRRMHLVFDRYRVTTCYNTPLFLFWTTDKTRAKGNTYMIYVSHIHSSGCLTMIESVYYHANLWSILGIRWMKTRESTSTPTLRGCVRVTCVKSSVDRGPGPVVRRCSYHCQSQRPDDPLSTPPTVLRSTSTPPQPVCSFVSYILICVYTYIY